MDETSSTGAADVPSGQSLLTSAATDWSDEALEKQKLERSLNRRFYLPRLAKRAYCGTAVVHWTLTMEDHAKGWLSPSFHAAFREIMLHAQLRDDLLCPIYCLMPDHMHLVWMGLREMSDQRKAMAFLRTHLKPLLAPARFQHQAHDHVLREDELRQHVFEGVCNYIANNPVQAELVSNAGDWGYTGTIVAGYPDLHPLTQGKFWKVLWSVYWKQRRREEK